MLPRPTVNDTSSRHIEGSMTALRTRGQRPSGTTACGAMKTLCRIFMNANPLVDQSTVQHQYIESFSLVSSGFRTARIHRLSSVEQTSSSAQPVLQGPKFIACNMWSRRPRLLLLASSGPDPPRFTHLDARKSSPVVWLLLLCVVFTA